MKTTPTYTIVVVVLLQCCLISCISINKVSHPSSFYSTSTHPITSADSYTKRNYTSSNYPTELTDYLKSFTCLDVKGNDVFGEVRIKGMGQIATKQGPLFVVNNLRMGHDLSRVAAAICIAQIAKVRVLRHPAELSIYGQAAKNGVIVIELVK